MSEDCGIYVLALSVAFSLLSVLLTTHVRDQAFYVILQQ